MSLLSEDTTAKGTFSGQESPQCCSQSRQDPRTYLPPGISQVAVKKSGKGKKGPGGRHPRMAVTFSGWISQKPAAAEPLLTPGSCLGTQSCRVGGMAASHVAEKHLSTYSHFPSAGIHLLSPVPCMAYQHLEAGGSLRPPPVQHPAVGLSAPAEVTDSCPESRQPQGVTMPHEAGGCI